MLHLTGPVLEETEPQPLGIVAVLTAAGLLLILSSLSVWLSLDLHRRLVTAACRYSRLISRGPAVQVFTHQSTIVYISHCSMPGVLFGGAGLHACCIDAWVPCIVICIVLGMPHQVIMGASDNPGRTCISLRFVLYPAISSQDIVQHPHDLG